MLGGGLTLMGTLLLGNASGNSTGMEEADEQEVSECFGYCVTLLNAQYGLAGIVCERGKGDDDARGRGEKMENRGKMENKCACAIFDQTNISTSHQIIL